MAAGEYPVGLDEGMGPEGTGQAHWVWISSGSNRSSTLLKFVGTILQVRRDGMDHPLGLCLSCRP